MLTRAEVERVIASLTYKPGYDLTVYDTAFQGTWLCIHACGVPDAYTPEQDAHLYVRSPIPPLRDEQAVLDWVRWRLEVVECHEVHEWLRHDGKPVFDPHGEGADQPA